MIWQNKDVLAVNIVASGASYYILLSLLSSHCYQDIKFPSAYLSSLLSVLLSVPLDSHCSSWLVTRKRRWREEESGGLLKIQSGPTEEEGRRLVGETEKQASRVSNPDLVTLSFSSVSLLTRLPSPAVRHPSDMNLIFNLFIFLCLHLSPFLSLSFSPLLSLWRQPYRAASYWKNIAFWRKTNKQTKNMFTTLCDLFSRAESHLISNISQSYYSKRPGKMLLECSGVQCTAFPHQLLKMSDVKWLLWWKRREMLQTAQLAGDYINT